MVEFTVHDENSASEDVAQALAKAKESFGFIPTPLDNAFAHHAWTREE